jgi:hypothetical protein
MVRQLTLTIIGLMLLVAVPASAGAGTYVVHGCTLPDGSPAPVDGWSF